MKTGTSCVITEDFQYGENFQCGHLCIIEADVVVGHDVKLGHNVMLKSGTRVGDRVEIADNCCTTGICLIGNDVMIRTGSCISKSVILNDFVFVGAGVMSSHTKNVYHGRPAMHKRQLITRVGYGAIIGSRVNLMAGVTIASGVIVGYGSNVVGDLLPAQSLFIGNPARFVKSIAGTAWAIDVPPDYEALEFDPALLAKYLPFYRGD